MNSRKVSAGRFLERFDESDEMKPERICWQAEGKAASLGCMGVYQYL